MAASREQIDQLYGYIQERCLWQFHSRTWDRQANIDNILALAGDLLTGATVAPNDPAARCWYADAKILVADYRKLFPWIESLGADEVRALLDGVKARLVETVITSSRNHELNHALY